MYHTPTHRSQTGPLSAGYGTVSDMATYNGYTYFFLDTPKYGPRGVVERQKRRTSPTRILECPCLAIPECHRCELGAARGNSSLLQSPAAGVDSHAPTDSGTDLTLAGQK